MEQESSTVYEYAIDQGVTYSTNLKRGLEQDSYWYKPLILICIWHCIMNIHYIHVVCCMTDDFPTPALPQSNLVLEGKGKQLM